MLLGLKALLNDFRQDTSAGAIGGGGGGGGWKQAQAAAMSEGMHKAAAEAAVSHEVEAAVARLYASQRKLLCRLHSDLTEAVTSARLH